MNFEETLLYLKQEKDSLIASECLNEMMNNEVLFNPGFEQERERLSSLYSLRLRISKDLHLNKLTEEELSNWELAVNNLEKSQAEKLELNWVKSNSKMYLLFWNKTSKNLEGIFYLNAKKSMEEEENYNEEIISKGFSVSSIKYVKGKKNKVWKI